MIGALLSPHLLRVCIHAHKVQRAPTHLSPVEVEGRVPPLVRNAKTQFAGTDGVCISLSASASTHMCVLCMSIHRSTYWVYRLFVPVLVLPRLHTYTHRHRHRHRHWHRHMHRFRHTHQHGLRHRHRRRRIIATEL